MSRFEKVDQLLRRFAAPGQGPAGCACAIGQDGQLLYEGYHGYADLEAGRPITEDTVFRLFSMTKVIVCTAALMLYERGEFLLNEPLYEYFPEFRHSKVVKLTPNGYSYVEEAKQPILIKHLFNMSAGLPYPSDHLGTASAMRDVISGLREKHGKYDLRTEIKALAEVALAFEPGTRWLYGYGHDLVAGLIEVISGKSVGQFLKEEIFEPLGMRDTAYRYQGDIESRMAAFYERTEEGKLVKVDPSLDEHHQPDAIYEAGGTGLYSTVRDYLAFSQMLACGGKAQGVQILGRKTIDLMRTNHLDETQLSDFRNSYHAGYGYGLGVRTMMDPALGHSNTSIREFGWTGFAGTWVSIDPSERFSVVYMHQMIPNMEEYHHLRVRAAAYGCL
ncbi:serine hydrolase [Paenibacillus sp. CAA11]|uniref:serine hydrolase domain-containing protein n=1 Tax=Paenibacillus sp. CAA11 TaxID=1532905 RepID=UPI000D3C78EC|nr:serine hydrolase domain-containing protein [Paenibacillus sp. CAA11]AWB43766.1 serine hydrolase [Paenibacillus sp. CAA11]